VATYVGLFRGINVGGHNKLPMRALAQLCNELGLSNVRTYIQSGNVVFESKRIASQSLVERLASAVERSHGFAPNLIILRATELSKTIASNPFPAAESDPKSLHLTFLSDVPTDADLGTLQRLARASERFSLDGKVFYLHAPEGIARSKLAAGIERALGVSGTSRNWRTVCAIQAMAKGEER
jgi:uncharacterized protein (DUF1697 family)